MSVIEAHAIGMGPLGGKHRTGSDADPERQRLPVKFKCVHRCGQLQPQKVAASGPRRARAWRKMAHHRLYQRMLPVAKRMTQLKYTSMDDPSSDPYFF
jgi:hypothetical protein